MNIQIASSKSASPRSAAQAIRRKLQGLDPRLVLFFASSKHDPASLSREMKAAFPQAAVLGCTTAGEIASGKMLNGTVVCMAFNAKVVQDVRIEVIENLKLHARPAVEKAFANFAAHFEKPMKDLDPGRYAGIILCDGLCGMEEQVMERMGDLTDIPFVGGSAGDDVQFKATSVFAEGKTYSNAAVLCVLKPGVRVDVLKTQSCKILKHQLVATKVNETSRQVLEFNGQPATKAYAQAVGVPVEKISEAFMRHPLGLIVDGEPYVRSPHNTDGSAICFFCNVPAGTELSLLESGDIVEDTRQALRQKQKTFGPIAGIVNFHCILRTLSLQQTGQTDAYGKLFKAVPTIGFSTYGEQYIGHINQTSTMLLLGKEEM